MMQARVARIFSLVLLLMTVRASVVSAQEGQVKPLTLEEAVSIARSHNRELKQAGLEVHKQQEAFSEARTQIYPRFDTYFLGSQLLTPLDFTVRSGTLGTFPATGPIPAKDSIIHTPARPVAITSVTATQPLTQLFRINLSIKQQKLTTQLSQQSYLEHEQILVNDVRHAYYAILQSQSEAQSQRALLAYLAELQQLTGRRLQQEAVLKADSLRITAQRTKALYQLTVIEDTLADHKETLNRLLGRDLLEEFTVEMVPASLPEESSLQQARKRAIEMRPEIRTETIKKERAALETRIEKTRYTPDVSIQANYATTSNLSFLPQNVGGVGVLLTWQPWDWGQKRHNIAQKVDAEKQAQLSIDDVRDRVLQEVDATFRRLREARMLLTAAQAARDAEAEKLRNELDAYSQQTIVLSDLLQQQSSAASAEDQYRQGLLAFWKARADFERAFGEE
ncbi:MAG TPA: TolC family protein [Candidatus Saccharimonadales bacterium]|nr:TolC family protein [Candidatus Saccharimonadales bacterium]